MVDEGFDWIRWLIIKKDKPRCIFCFTKDTRELTGRSLSSILNRSPNLF
jgi:hypothetical protein